MGKPKQRFGETDEQFRQRDLAYRDYQATWRNKTVEERKEYYRAKIETDRQYRNFRQRAIAATQAKIAELQAELVRLQDMALLLDDPADRGSFEAGLGLRPTCPECARRLTIEPGPLCFRCAADERRA